MASKRFDTRINVLVTDLERRMLDDLADRDGLTPSDVVRQLIRRAHRDAFGEAPTARRRKGRK